MATCPSCNAPVPGDALTCPFCATITQRGLEVREEERRRESEREEQARREEARRRDGLVAEARREARNAFVVSLVGLPCCVFGIPAVVAMVMAHRARKLARAQGAPAPGLANVATAIAGVSLAGLVVAGVAFAIDSHRLGARRDALREQVAAFTGAETLDEPQACAVAELHLLDHGWRKYSSINFKRFYCPGKVAAVDEGLVLEDLRFYASNDLPDARVDVCFSRGSRWAVQSVLPHGEGCGGEKAEPAPVQAEAAPGD